MAALPHPELGFLWQALSVAVGGAAGAVARWGVSLWLARPGVGFPWATLVVNAAGCLAIGVVMGWLTHTESSTGVGREVVRLGVAVGMLGGLTTFSTFGYETLSLAQQGRVGTACLNAALNLGVSLVAVGLGWWIARALSRA